MKKYKVYGMVTIGLTMNVEAESEEDAREKAYKNYPGLMELASNAIGTPDPETLILESCENEPTFNDVAEQEEDS